MNTGCLSHPWYCNTNNSCFDELLYSERLGKAFILVNFNVIVKDNKKQIQLTTTWFLEQVHPASDSSTT